MLPVASAHPGSSGKLGDKEQYCCLFRGVPSARLPLRPLLAHGALMMADSWVSEQQWLALWDSLQVTGEPVPEKPPPGGGASPGHSNSSSRISFCV